VCCCFLGDEISGISVRERDDVVRVRYICVCCCFLGDEISGISVSVRERDDIVTIWNTQSRLAEECNILEKVKELVPEVSFTASFYKGMLIQY